MGLERGDLMNFTYVNSSDLNGIAINGNNLIIKFNSGDIYEYIGAAREYDMLLNASSKGKYFYQFIKDNYQFIKIN